MSNISKRRKQTTILECFKKSKQLNSTLNLLEFEPKLAMTSLESQELSSKEERRELLASAAEKRIASNSNSPESEATEIDETELDSQSSLVSFNNSEDFFNDTDGDEWLALAATPSDGNDPDVSMLKRSTDNNIDLLKLTPSENHTILFRPHIIESCSPRPYPDSYRDKWDTDHVRMPCSPLNRYPVECSFSGEIIVQNRWDIICNAFNRRIDSSADLENAIMEYNRQYTRRWDFRGLHAFLNTHLDSNQKNLFFQETLPGIIEYALQLPFICTKPIPLLKKHKDHTITISQRQVACLLANAFLCTFPKRNQVYRHELRKGAAEYANYPHINFNKLFIGTKNGMSQKNYEKLKCLLNYFSRVVEKEPTGTISYHRQCLDRFPNWATSNKSISEAVICVNGLIEDQAGMLQVDFANRFVGGGVLGQGCVQEEIRFITCPELIISRLFTEALDDNEALIITGVEQYSKYAGYAESFLFDGDCGDTTPRDSWGRRKTEVVAIDALPFRKTIEQYKLSLIKREMNKAFVGFFKSEDCPEIPSAVATGNWGCGAFRGSTHLKFLVQLMAASEADRGMLYFTFGNKLLVKEFNKMHQFIAEKKLTVGKLYAVVVRYSLKVANIPESLFPNLFDFVYKTVNSELKPIPSLDSTPIGIKAFYSSAKKNEKDHNSDFATRIETKCQSDCKRVTETKEDCKLSQATTSRLNSKAETTEIKCIFSSNAKPSKWPTFMD